MKYAEQFCDWLVEEGYTHCFFVAGGNTMHLLDAARSRFACVPFVHEVGAGIATEYFNELVDQGGGRAFALVTAGPGLTNIITAMAGAFLESRELLVLGGQVKSADLATGHLRQRGIQEINGVRLAESVCKIAFRISEPTRRNVVVDAIREGSRARKGPVFLEICLDAQGAQSLESNDGPAVTDELDTPECSAEPLALESAARILRTSSRPVVLLGGGISRSVAPEVLRAAEELGVPIATTWNGADRIPSSHPLYFGRPNTWGMRWSNVLLQQADVVVAAGSRLGMQQTGFNWQGFAPLARVIQIDLDDAELGKGHPHLDLAIAADANTALLQILTLVRDEGIEQAEQDAWREWRDFAAEVRAVLPLQDPGNSNAPGYVDPFWFMQQLSGLLDRDDVIVPCSSGGAFTVSMQALEQKEGQRIATDKGLASMGYGLSGAIGAAMANREHRTILVEGDGGFAQNLQEVGTAVAQGLPLKMFIFCNEGYASIRMTQRNYFGGQYVGCDTKTGLGLPDWAGIFSAYSVPVKHLVAESPFDEDCVRLMNDPGPAAFLVPIDPEQTFYPKINSRVTPSGAMESSPLHAMFPDLDDDLSLKVLKYLDRGR